MARRDEIINKAREIIKDNPTAGRRIIARELRDEYGQGLRDAVILKLQREIYPRATLAIEAKREKSLIKDGFTPAEAKELKRLTLTKVKYLQTERRKRAKEKENFIADLKGKGVTRRQAEKQYRDMIKDRYKEKGHIVELTKEGKERKVPKIDPWQMFRDMRAEAMKSPDWRDTPLYKGLSHRLRDKAGRLRRIDKGRVKEQRARERERSRASKKATAKK